MKRILQNITSFFTPRIGNLLFAIVPMLYILYTFFISYHGHHPWAAITGIAVTFLLFVYVHIKYLRKQRHWADKLRLQIILANFAVEYVMIIIALDNSDHVKIGMTGIIVTSLIALIFVLLFTVLQIRDNGTIKNAFTGLNLYHSMIAITMSIFTVFFVYECYIFWSTWFIFVPVITGSIMLATIYKNGIAYENSESPLNLFATIPFMFAIGIISLIFQFAFKPIIYGILLWKIVACAAGIAILVYVLDTPHRRNRALNRKYELFDEN